MLVKPYPPLPPVVATRDSPVSLWRILTVAPGTTASLASVTLPSNVPYRACAVQVPGAERFRRVARLTGTSQRMLRTVLINKEDPPFVKQMSIRSCGETRHESRSNREHRASIQT